MIYKKKLIELLCVSLLFSDNSTNCFQELFTPSNIIIHSLKKSYGASVV